MALRGDRTEHKAELGWMGQSGADKAFPHRAFCNPDVLRFFFQEEGLKACV